jgi:16S rRNA (uracil1498-N3)-methyltransferase
MSENELTNSGGRLRLHVEAPLGIGLSVMPGEQQSHYLLHVMRAKIGNHISLFNGRDGEWVARIVEISKRSCILQCERQSATQTEVPDVWLCFAPIKKTPADYVVQKATELGVRALQPVFTRRTIVSRVNVERMRANAVEAAEQSGRLSVPETREPLALDRFLSSWPNERRLIFCDEGGDAKPFASALAPDSAHAFAILTGPEGGFDPLERDALRALPFVTPATLGPRILRADTAALAALAIWQSLRGDWH